MFSSTLGSLSVLVCCATFLVMVICVCEECCCLFVWNVFTLAPKQAMCPESWSALFNTVPPFSIIRSPFTSPQGLAYPVLLDFCSLRACWRVQFLWEDLDQYFPQIAEVSDAGVNSSFLWDNFRSSSWNMSLFSTGSVHPHIHPFLLSSSNYFHFSSGREGLRPQPNSPSLLHSRLESFEEKPQDSAASRMWVEQVGWDVVGAGPLLPLALVFCLGHAMYSSFGCCWQNVFWGEQGL